MLRKVDTADGDNLDEEEDGDDEDVNADGDHYQHCVCNCIWRWASDSV